MIGELDGCDWDIISFSETRCDWGVATLPLGAKLLTSTQHTQSAGVAVLVHKHHVKSVLKHFVQSERLMYVDLALPGCIVRCISVYMPHMGYPAEELETVYEQLHQIVEAASRLGLKVLIGGDFNTQLDVGRRGDLLSELCHSFELNVANDQPGTNSWTFCSSLGVKRRLDYIIYSSYLTLVDGSPTDALDLGSDHRAVHAKFHMAQHPRKPEKKQTKRGWKPKDFDRYHDALQEQISHNVPKTIPDVEALLLSAVHKSDQLHAEVRTQSNVWDNAEFQELLSLRRACSNNRERCGLSKHIRKMLRKQLRERRNRRTSEILQSFRHLSDLEMLKFDPVRVGRDHPEASPCPMQFATFLADIFRSERDVRVIGASEAACCPISPFSIEELRRCLSEMKTNKGGDNDGLVLEMFKCASSDLHMVLLNVYNDMIATRQFEPKWQHTIFKMLPKGGNSSDVNNWRPIAALQITYKIFSKMLHNRLKSLLDTRQSADQFGFRPGVEWNTRCLFWTRL